jgi:hypothetical protein
MQTSSYCSDAGSNDTYACNLSPAITAYVTGTHYRFKANTINTGAASINFNTVGALTIVKLGGGITTALADNDIRAGQWVECVYDGTNCQMQGQLGNAAAGGGGSVIGGGCGNINWGGPDFEPFFGGVCENSETSATALLAVASTISKLRFRLSGSIAAASTVVYTLYVAGADTALTCTVAASTATCTDLTNSVSVAAGDTITWHTTSTGTPGTFYSSWSVLVVPN